MRSSRPLYAGLVFILVAAGLGLLAVAAEGSAPDLGDEVVIPAGGTSPTPGAETPTTPVPTTSQGTRPTVPPTATAEPTATATPTRRPTGSTTGAVPVSPRSVPTAGDDDADDAGESDDGVEADDE